ncbi:MAG: nucleotidyltransferase domain-containing protein [Spirochaetales bacterium]|nr:nucleotidyltransferase domain-containing protein [Spirochaetales bacterium]
MTEAQGNRQEIINYIKDSLIKTYNPSAIYLFGSFAWGTPNEESDLDFAVIVPSSSLSMAERIRLSYKELWGLGVPTDIIVYTESEIREKSRHPSTLPYKILSQGTKIYEAA